MKKAWLDFTRTTVGQALGLVASTIPCIGFGYATVIIGGSFGWWRPWHGLPDNTLFALGLILLSLSALAAAGVPRVFPIFSLAGHYERLKEIEERQAQADQHEEPKTL